MKKHLIFLQIIIFCLSESVSYSQQEGWAELNLGHNLTANNQYAVGGTCLIFAENSSATVYAFSIISGKWSSRTIPTSPGWDEAISGGNTAMIYNDSLAVFYSAISDSFVLLRFEGQIMTLGKKCVGGKENYCYLVTDTKIYVFDAVDSQIRSLSYTRVGTDSPGGGIYDYGDYFCMSIWNTDPQAHTLVAYSSITKTITEFIYGSAYSSWTSLEFLDHGFVLRPTAGAPYLCGGYSAYTGTFVTKLSDNLPITGILPAYDPASVDSKLCYLFTFRGELNVEGIATMYLWAYNTLSGSFDEFSYNFHYNNSHLVPDFYATGGQGALHTVYDKDNGDKVNLIAYNALTRTFSQHNFNITYDYRNNYYIGGHIIAITSKDKLVFYDFLNNTVSIHQSDWPSGQFPNVNSIKAGDDYGVITYIDPADQGTTIISFNGTSGLTGYPDFIPQSYFTVAFAGVNYAFLPQFNFTEPGNNLIYSKVNDGWIRKQIPAGVTYGYKNTYCFHRNNNTKTTVIFDSKSGTETIISAYPSTLISKDSMFAMYGSDQKMYGYSSFNNSIVSYPLNFYSNTLSERIIFYYNPASSTDINHLLYDASLCKFVPLSVNELTHGSGLHIAAGLKTALRVCNKGYLFAYSPNAVGSGEVPFVGALATPDHGEIPLAVQFNAQVTGGNAPVSFKWDFGDGSTSILPNPIHSFSLPGTYTVKVTVTDADGDTGSDFLQIIAKELSTGTEEHNIFSPGVYPVPAKDNLVVLVPEAFFNGSTVNIRIMDFYGKYVSPGKDYEITGNSIPLNIAHLPDGLYILQMTDHRIIYNLKIIKKR
jgi:PKD repeat protein